MNRRHGVGVAEVVGAGIPQQGAGAVHGIVLLESVCVCSGVVSDRRQGVSACRLRGGARQCREGFARVNGAGEMRQARQLVPATLAPQVLQRGHVVHGDRPELVGRQKDALIKFIQSAQYPAAK